MCFSSPHCFKVYSSFEIYHSHDNGITRNRGITMLDQTDRMSAVSSWQIYHLTRDQKRKSEGQKCNIYNAVSRWMHTKHLISRPLESRGMFAAHKRSATGVPSISFQYEWALSPTFPSTFPKNSKKSWDTFQWYQHKQQSATTLIPTNSTWYNKIP